MTCVISDLVALHVVVIVVVIAVVKFVVVVVDSNRQFYTAKEHCVLYCI